MADTARHEALRLLARRDLSAARLRARLEDRGFPLDEIEAALARLVDDGALDDGRVARAHARTAVSVKGRGRLRVMRELHEMGIDAGTAARALAEVFGEIDERALVNRAIQRKLRGRVGPDDPAGHARLYQYLLRQGFSHAAALAGLRRLQPGRHEEQE